MAKTAKLSKDGAGLGIEKKLWAAADKMRGKMDASEYKHIALGLLFLKYISDNFIRKYESLDPQKKETRDYYAAVNIFYVPQNARWQYLRDNAPSPQIGKIIDEAMNSIEKENPNLRGVLPKEYASPLLDKVMLGGLINIFSDLDLYQGDTPQDVLGRVYEYFLKMFASADNKKGGEFYTPRSIVKLLVEIIEPLEGRVYDPCCGSGGMFVQAQKFVAQHSGRINDVSIFGQEANPTTWRLCKMNLAIRQIEAQLGQKAADTFHNDLHKDLRADFILANPPFNVSDWGAERLQGDARWKYGMPPSSNANYAWIEHMIYHLSPRGVIGLVLANGSLSSDTSGEGEIRKKLIEAGLIDCMIVLPAKLFYSVGVPACLWFIRRGRPANSKTLFIDARQMGYMVTRANRDFTDADIAKIADTYHSWRRSESSQKSKEQNLRGRVSQFCDTEASKNPAAKSATGFFEGSAQSQIVGGGGGKKYKDVEGFCKSASISDIAAQRFVLSPGRYVGIEDSDEDEATFIEKMNWLIEYVKRCSIEQKRLDIELQKQLKKINKKFAEIDCSKIPSIGLEAIAQELFKSWFVDFEPFGGSKPRDWEQKPISELINILSGFAFSGSDYVKNGKYKLVTIKNVQDGNFISETDNNLAQIPDKMPDYCNLQTGNILLSLTGNVGRLCFVIGENYLLNQRVAKLQPKNKNDLFFTYLLFKTKEMFNNMQGLAVGSAQQNLSPILTGQIIMPIPSRKILDDFYNLTSSIMHKILGNELQSRSLANIRDALLPRLMLGKIRVS